MSFNLQQEWANVSGAPLSFLGTVLVSCIVIWTILFFLNKSKIENLVSRLQLRDDEIADYKRKLEGASPDEAKAKIESLEARLSS